MVVRVGTPQFIDNTSILKYITRTIWILSLVSLFTDTASEMLYPIMPIYLKSIGFSIRNSVRMVNKMRQPSRNVESLDVEPSGRTL